MVSIVYIADITQFKPQEPRMGECAQIGMLGGKNISKAVSEIL